VPKPWQMRGPRRLQLQVWLPFRWEKENNASKFLVKLLSFFVWFKAMLLFFLSWRNFSSSGQVHRVVTQQGEGILCNFPPVMNLFLESSHKSLFSYLTLPTATSWTYSPH
jgi:hypothetical protein